METIPPFSGTKRDQVHELPSESDVLSICPSSSVQSLEIPFKSTELLLNIALLARIKSLEAEDHHPKTGS